MGTSTSTSPPSPALLPVFSSLPLSLIKQHHWFHLHLLHLPLCSMANHPESSVIGWAQHQYISPLFLRHFLFPSYLTEQPSQKCNSWLSLTLPYMHTYFFRLDYPHTLHFPPNADINYWFLLLHNTHIPAFSFFLFVENSRCPFLYYQHICQYISIAFMSSTLLNFFIPSLSLLICLSISGLVQDSVQEAAATLHPPTPPTNW